MTTISANLQAVRERIAAAEREYGRAAGSVHLLAVSKTKPAEYVRLAAAAGQLAFGENYVQEGISKVQELGELELEWHFIGPLQSNKTRKVAEHFDWVHSIDRLKIAERLAEQRPAGRPPLSVCIEVNISAEAAKGGVSPDDAIPLAHALADLPQLRLRGLMAIPAPSEDFSVQRQAFRQLHTIYERLRADGLPLDTLSMGMSHDLEAAIAEGATLVRVGTAIFGERTAR